MFIKWLLGIVIKSSLAIAVLTVVQIALDHEGYHWTQLVDHYIQYPLEARTVAVMTKYALGGRNLLDIAAILWGELCFNLNIPNMFMTSDISDEILFFKASVYERFTNASVQ